jgi:DNA topoisomerase-1
MLKNFVIVESPSKAKTIEKYLGKDYAVRSCGGHICDLPEMGKGIVVGIKNGNEPTFEIIADKKELVAKLKDEASASVHVWLATDEDREGEAIAWHLKVALGLDDEKYSRITFTEITKPAILQAMKKPRKINDDLVNAWKARRVLDYLLGYDVSQLLWKKVQKGLSAGRVQIAPFSGLEQPPTYHRRKSHAESIRQRLFL